MPFTTTCVKYADDWMGLTKLNDFEMAMLRLGISGQDKKFMSSLRRNSVDRRTKWERRNLMKSHQKEARGDGTSGGGDNDDDDGDDDDNDDDNDVVDDNCVVVVVDDDGCGEKDF